MGKIILFQIFQNVFLYKSLSKCKMINTTNVMLINSRDQNPWRFNSNNFLWLDWQMISCSSAGAFHNLGNPSNKTKKSWELLYWRIGIITASLSCVNISINTTLKTTVKCAFTFFLSSFNHHFCWKITCKSLKDFWFVLNKGIQK